MLYATRMVRTGVERAYGEVLRLRLRRTMDRPVLAVVLGAGLAIAFQSSTAVTLLVSSFAGSGIVGGLPAQLAVRGAEVGSALVAKLLTFDLSLLVPVLLIAGTTLFMVTERRVFRQVGRIFIGVGLLLLSLEMIGMASEPLRDSAAMPAVVSYFSNDPVTAYLLAAVVTWLFHSSIAAVLLLATLAGRGLVPAILPLFWSLASISAAPSLHRSSPGQCCRCARGSDRQPADARPWFAGLPRDLSRAAPAAGIPWCRGSWPSGQRSLAFQPDHPRPRRAALAPLLRRVRADREPDHPSTIARACHRYRTFGARRDGDRQPALALANATREVVRICELVEVMLQRIIRLYEDADEARITALASLDDRLDRKHAAIKIYLAKITASELDRADALRCQELLGACVKLEQVGDIIVRNMLAHVRKKMKHGLQFTQDGWSELAASTRCPRNGAPGLQCLVSRDLETARQIVEGEGPAPRP